MLDAAIVIVNYRTADRVCALVDELFGAESDAPAEIAVVDNSPAGGLAERPAMKHTRVRYVAAPSNEGFAAGVNRGIAFTREPVVILLNPDARPEPGCLSGLRAQLAAAESAAVAGPLLVPEDDTTPPTPSALSRDPSPLDLLTEYSFLGRLRRRPPHIVPPSAHSPHPAPLECAMVQGACFALRRDWHGKVGDFDARRFFLYWEETDYCRRVRQAGGRVLYCPDLRCRHEGGASTADGRQDVEAFWRSLYRYVEKYDGRTAAAALRMALVMGVGMEWVLARLAARLRPHGPDHARYIALLARRWQAQFA